MLSFEDDGKLTVIPGLAIQPTSGFVPATAFFLVTTGPRIMRSAALLSRDTIG